LCLVFGRRELLYIIDVRRRGWRCDLWSNSVPTVESWRNEDLFCHDLPSEPRPEVGRILVTGASGYIGGRLVPELLARGYQVRVMVRAPSPEYGDLWPGAEIVVADALEIDELRQAFEGVSVAYYLIHSLHLGPEEFAAADIQAAINFREAAEEAGCQRIIYLGGLGDTRTVLSNHLQSRLEVAEELKRGRVPVTILRAAIIIGSGSASYEIIEHLVRNLFVIPIPPWGKNRCQPIAIRDVIKYLVGVLEIPESSGQSFDIGGPDILTYRMMVKTQAAILRKRRIFLPLPVSHIGFYAYFASLFTPVPALITRCLMEGLRDEVVCQNNAIKKLLPFRLLSYREALIRAMSREEQDDVHTRWSDAYPPAHELALKLHELEDGPSHTTSYSITSSKPACSLFASICKIGGKGGWAYGNWMWRLRGWVDRILLGVGSSRGRKSFSTLKINDVIDFWRVEDLQPDKRLLLRAEMRLPGRAWLEFNIEDQDGTRTLSVTAYYDTKSVFGKLYWYFFLPFHVFIFNGLIKQIEKRS